jgi:hypothetical protein
MPAERGKEQVNCGEVEHTRKRRKRWIKVKVRGMSDCTYNCKLK